MKQFKSDFGIVANFFVNKRKNPKYVPDDKREFKHVDAVLKFLGVMTGDKEYENLLNNPNFKKEGANMCSVVQNLKEEGRFEEIFSSVQDGLYPVEVGAKRARMAIPEFEKAMVKAGYKVPAEV